MLKPEEELPALTKEQQQLVAANYLKMLVEEETDPLPFEIFVPIGRLVVLNTVEVGFVKPSPIDDRRAQVLLVRRPETDQFWANQWHIPGSIVRATDPVKHEHDYDAAISRVIKEVGGGIQVKSNPLEYDVVRRKGVRGSEVTVRLMAESAGEPINGAFFDTRAVLKNPPEVGLIESHAEAIEKLAAKYYDLRAK
jgi:hypothetical protein